MQILLSCCCFIGAVLLLTGICVAIAVMGDRD